MRGVFKKHDARPFGMSCLAYGLSADQTKAALVRHFRDKPNVNLLDNWITLGLGDNA